MFKVGRDDIERTISGRPLRGQHAKNILKQILKKTHQII